MRKGEIVIIIEPDGEFFDVGDKGRLLRPSEDDDGCWWVDFNGFGNLEVSGDGKWCVMEDDMCLAYDEDPEEVMA